MSEQDGNDRDASGPADDPDSGFDEGDAEAARSSRSAPEKQKKHLPLGLEMVLLLSLALVLAVVIKAFFLQAFYIPSGSMNDTLVFNDRILVEKPSYWSGGPERGDIVVFEDPGGWLGTDEGKQAATGFAKVLEVFGLYPTGGHLVKRVIGIGGDHVVCCDDDGRLTVNGIPLNEEDYIASGAKPSERKFDQTVPEGYLWVMGDNRPSSADSRAHLGDPGGGFVPVDDVVGKVFAVVWPLGHAKFLHRPDTYEALE
ncbi:MAG TPA: signal peptidase I [Nocardioidaceae bacterium]|nr:signal peptidase I [Nocardioidaceae bacterium]